MIYRWEFMTQKQPQRQWKKPACWRIHWFEIFCSRFWKAPETDVGNVIKMLFKFNITLLWMKWLVSLDLEPFSTRSSEGPIWQFWNRYLRLIKCIFLRDSDILLNAKICRHIGHYYELVWNTPTYFCMLQNEIFAFLVNLVLSMFAW